MTSIIEEKTQVFLASKLNKSFESKLKRLQGRSGYDILQVVKGDLTLDY